MAKKMRVRVMRSFLRHTAKTVPQAENMNQRLLYKLLLISQRFMTQILDPFGLQRIRLFLRQHDVIFDCATFGLIECGQRFDFMQAVHLIRIFKPKTVEFVIIGRNLRFNQLRQFLVNLKPVVPLFTTTHHKNLQRSVQTHQQVLLETIAGKLSRVELFENQIPFLLRGNNILEKCVVHCKSRMGCGQLSLVLKTKCRVLVGRYRIREFFDCEDCPAQPVIQDLQLINDDAAWQVFCQPDPLVFFDLLHSKLPNLKRLILGMSERMLLRDGQRWTFNCVDDLVMQLVNFNRHQFLNKNHDIREHCRSQIQNVHRLAKEMKIELFLCYDTQGMYSIYETPKLYPIQVDAEPEC